MEGVGQVSLPKISVIMLTYNREKLVGRMAECIYTQTFRDFEFIIVDNGSTDRSGAVADEYAAKDDRIRVFHRQRGNIGSGRNVGLDAAQGEYIVFVDDDDSCAPDFLEFLYKMVVENKADVAICGVYKAPKSEDKSVSATELLVMDAKEAIVELMWRKRYNNGFPTKLFKYSLFKGLRFPETGRYDDIYLMYKVLAGAKKVSYHSLPKYHVYRHDGNNSLATTKDTMITPEYLSDYRMAYRERTEWLCKHFPDEANYWWYFDFSFQISMVNKIIANELEGCENHLLEMQHELYENSKTFLNCPYILDYERKWFKLYVMEHNKGAFDHATSNASDFGEIGRT